MKSHKMNEQVASMTPRKTTEEALELIAKVASHTYQDAYWMGLDRDKDSIDSDDVLYAITFEACDGMHQVTLYGCELEGETVKDKALSACSIFDSMVGDEYFEGALGFTRKIPTLTRRVRAQVNSMEMVA